PGETVRITPYWDDDEIVEVGIRFSKRAAPHDSLVGREVRVVAHEAAVWLALARPDHFLKDGTCVGGCGVERYWDWAP
ncbi:MAG TPA: hypothetical protein VNI83_04135, partial [Vicinamibacterales bacterium]|nr:hypothetical protein [Vicinamibacterales bacterium]